MKMKERKLRTAEEVCAWLYLKVGADERVRDVVPKLLAKLPANSPLRRAIEKIKNKQ